MDKYGSKSVNRPLNKLGHWLHLTKDALGLQVFIECPAHVRRSALDKQVELLLNVKGV